MHPQRLKKIQRHLAAQDPKMVEVIAASPPPKSVPATDIYKALLQSIVSQQLSVKAADTIFNRVLDQFEERYPEPARLLAMREEELRAVGLSRQKAGYLQNVARFHLEQGMHHAELDPMEDEEIIAYLTTIKGVGRWTVEMLLLFPLDRPDVFPPDDLGIQQAMVALYRLRSKGPALRKRMLQRAEAWRPYRSVATKYLWTWKHGTLDVFDS